MLLEGKIAIVTGGGRGIGRAIARRFAAEGARVLVAARTGSEVQNVAHEIEAAGGNAASVAADVSKEEGCEQIVAAARRAFGPVDILVNNAGTFGSVRPVEEIPPEEWDEVIAVNLRGPYLLSRLVIPEMYRRETGAILNISSVAAKAAYQWNAPYAASKSGLLGLTRTLAAESARRGVRVNAISPGPVPETKISQDLGRELAERIGQDPEVLLKNFLQTILQGRAQTTGEIAAAALFLVSDQASAITGQTLNVDGGMIFC
jgi:NAD(P)-dependent dehydrogenase (short-subunit alcohol dehydrogenase family)